MTSPWKGCYLVWEWGGDSEELNGTREWDWATAIQVPTSYSCFISIPSSFVWNPKVILSYAGTSTDLLHYL